MPTTYDLAIPLGEACSATQVLRAAGLQYLSFPYDWIGTSETETERAKHDLVTRATQLASRFDGWLKPEDFTFFATTPDNKKDVYINKPLGPKGSSIRDGLPQSQRPVSPPHQAPSRTRRSRQAHSHCPYRAPRRENLDSDAGFD